MCQTTRMEADRFAVTGADTQGTATNPVLPHKAAFGDGMWMGACITCSRVHMLFPEAHSAPINRRGAVDEVATQLGKSP